MVRFTVCLCVCLGLLQFTGQKERLCKQQLQRVCVCVCVCVCVLLQKDTQTFGYNIYTFCFGHS